ncbi:MAG: helix-turn-helix domain-containing protein [Myxococcota bacterium]
MNDAERTEEPHASFDVAHAVAVSRRAGMIATCVWLLLLAGFEPSIWRLLTLVAALCLFAGAMLFQHHGPKLESVGKPLGLLTTLYLGQGLLIFATGGIESPMLIMVPMTCMMMGFATGQWSALPLVIAGPTFYVALLLALRIAGFNVLPTLFASEPLFEQSWAFAIALCLAAGIMGGSITGTLIRAPWPGNIRQLEHLIQRLVALATEPILDTDPFQAHSKPSSSGAFVLKEQVDAYEHQLIREALQRFDHNQSETARQLGVSRITLINKMKKYGLR